MHVSKNSKIVNYQKTNQSISLRNVTVTYKNNAVLELNAIFIN